jgi:hypothetical protein
MIERRAKIGGCLYEIRATCYNEPAMLDLEKTVAQTPLWSDPQAWAQILNSIESFIDFKCKDQTKGYLELKGFAERQLARLAASQLTPPPDLKDEIMPERTEKPTPLETARPLSSSLNELLKAVVDDPETWLATPSEQLGWRKPGDLIGTDEEGKIVCLLQAVDQGLF